MRVTRPWLGFLVLAVASAAACGEDGPALAPSDTSRDAGRLEPGLDGSMSAAPPTASNAGLTFRADIAPVLRAEDALEGTFIPPYRSCVEPLDDKPGNGPDGKVCTNVAISGATEPGRYFPDYGSCDIVLTQRPFWSVPPAAASLPDDPRLDDAAYLAELGWVSEQIEATGCVCCHDSKQLGKQAGEWDIRLGPLWLDSLSDTGLALFAGLADSSSLGAYPAADNNGFERDVTGVMSTDAARMKAFMLAELARRGISEDEARAAPPFGGPIYTNRVTKPKPCAAGEGVTKDGEIVWRGGPARYVYVGSAEGDNPGVPPNLDLPDDTLLRLDVLPSQPPVASGVAYGSTPAGTFQSFPESTPAEPLTVGQTYHLTVLRDVGLPIANCTFKFGDEVPAVEVPRPAQPLASQDGGVSESDGGGTMPVACTLAGGDAEGWGAPCKESVDCTCAANYCALQPGKAEGYCSKTGCKDDPSVCPGDWTCFDISMFAPGQPAVCTK
jgi:hypothetical protein